MPGYQGERQGRLDAGRLRLDWQWVGTGAPVALLHAAPFVDWYAPLQASLSGWSVLTYRRLLDPSAVSAPFDLAEDAQAFEELAEYLGLRGVHLVGHSYGGLLALEVARRRRTSVRSLTLVEPAGAGFLAPEQAEQVFAPLMETYRTRGAVVAIDEFLSSVCGVGYRDQLAGAVPEAWPQVCRFADQFFQAELPAVVRWRFGPEDAGALHTPTLIIVGAATDARFARAADLVQGWLPTVARVDLPGVNHLLIAQAPDQIAGRMRSMLTEITS